MNMFKPCTLIVCLIIILSSCGKKEPPCESAPADQVDISLDSLAKANNWPAELSITHFSGPDVTPSPACLAVAPTGEVFVGVDMMGSLGKEPGKGKVVRLLDCNNDGVVDKTTTYATLDNPRGLFPIGDKLFVLHTAFANGSEIATGMDLVVYEDKDNDGVADGPSKPLIENICSPKFIQSRGTDHATNGIRMGIDGWIYIAVGDFGFHGAQDRSGKKMTMLGGGIVRVRPDGTEMEVYTHGLRNIYDVAIDPYMNIYTRGNTNDGGGWNIRFIHQIQSGEYGYPVLFKHFTDEIIPALVDVGGGSGTGSLYLQDPNWPAKYNNVPMMADWGRNHLYIHRVTEDGPSFTQDVEDFIKLSQVTDVDVDASGRMYLAAWNGAGYKGSPDKGYVVRAVPRDLKYESFPDLSGESIGDLEDILKSESAVARLHAQQELVKRGSSSAKEAAWDVASDQDLPLYVRVAGIFGYVQIAGKEGVENLLKLAEEDQVREFALRALADRKEIAKDLPTEPFVAALKDPSPRVRVAAAVALGRIGNKAAAEALLEVPVPASAKTPAWGTEGPHATPNAAIVEPHVAVRALESMNAVEACVDAIGGKNSALALWALRYMHDSRAVDGLIAAYSKVSDESIQQEIVTTLSRLYKKEAPYDGSWWWQTRPDTHGPYYKAIEWEGSAKIKAFLMQVQKEGDKDFFAKLNEKHRMGIPEFGEVKVVAVKEEKGEKIDLEKIKNKKGQIGKTSIEDVMLAMDDIKGDPVLGEKLFARQGCVACHNLKMGETMKGPFMGQIGSIMNRQQIAESILKPNASISQGFASVSVKTKDGKSYMGFVSKESSEELELRNIAGQVFTIKKSDITKQEVLETSMMPAGLANSMSFEEFASLITFLAQQK